MSISHEELKKIIVDNVKAVFEKTGQGVFLSSIGLLLAKNCPQFKELLAGRKLADFIRKELSGEIDIISHTSDPLIKVVVPHNDDVGINVGSVEPEVSDIGIGLPRYSRAVWSAFSKEVRAGFLRVIKLSQNTYFRDIPSSSGIPEGFYLVDNAPAEGAPKSSESTHQRIQTWLDKNKIELELVLAGKDSVDSERGKPLSLLERIVSALPEADLKRIQLPLDVVERLLREF
ncbi:hypothetical protein BK649_05970 [Pseudomonas canadensis]|uniref:Uncharacterized protein n=1 Tax=Pseudomonas canadensis TaxID=915099 RepID=A0A423FG86_9PSED|nr:hypothetical protein [Pseudomonas canadensis]ROM56503.1 hypothetical protein BK649_05970 [Pseudomonas canadensis]